mmetsp:Transcript_1389/g.3032  ORF Transcript_1389/g.3032 Transcript_1389/m.3032 type:complete len:772 (-) Transcript_1389:640-2955(-)
MVVCKARAESSIGLESSNVVTWREEGAFEQEMELAKQVELGATDFGICTAFGTYHGGRIYLFRTDSRDTMERWSETITRVMTSYVGYPVVRMNRIETIRRKVRWFYVGDRCQVFVAGIIMCNFLLNIFEAHFNAPPDSPLAGAFDQIDLLFTVFFTVELVINIFATWFAEFVSDGWNWFDFGVVLVSLLSLVLTNLPGANILRLMRCFRVFRLFKRIPSLRQIMVALTASIPPMINAFALVCLVTAIYAIMSVTFFSSYAPEEFGDFFTGMFTMFQVMTGDNWSDIARGLFTLTGQDTGVAIFFVSFHLIVALVLLNVVIAVLLDEFSKAADQRNSEVESTRVGSEEIEACPFEKISRELSKYKNLEDLETKINNLYDKILYTTVRKKYDLFTQEVAREDGEILRVYFNRWKTGEVPNIGDGCMGFAEFRMGLKNIGFIPPILVTRQIWDDYIMRPRLCDEGGILNRQGFMLLMKQALKRHQLRQLNACMEDENDDWNKSNIKSLFLGIKGMLLEDEEHARLEKTPLGPIDDENSIASTRDGKPDVSMDYDPQVDQLLRRLIADMHKMHSRFDAVEMDLQAIRSARTRFKKGTPRNHVNGEKKKDKEDAKKSEISEQKFDHHGADSPAKAKGLSAQGADQQASVQVKHESKPVLTDSFIEKQAASRRALQTPDMRETEATDHVNNLSQRGGHLTHRGAAPDRMWSLGAFAQNFTDKTLSPVQVPDFSNPSKFVDQSKDAANKMMDGLMGGLATIGSNMPFVHGNGKQASHG